MNPLQQTTLPLSEIIVADRFRENLGDIDKLADSISRIGLVVPLIVNTKNHLVDGGRRYAAVSKLNWQSVPITYREDKGLADHHEAELEANKNRLDFTWQEECKLIERIHHEKRAQGFAEGVEWGQAMTGELFKMSNMMISYSLRLAYEIRTDPEGKVAKADSATEGWRCIMQREQDAARAEAARRHAENSTSLSEFLGDGGEQFIIPGVGEAGHENSHLQALQTRASGEGYLDLNKEEAKSLYLANPHNPPDEFEAYYTKRTEFLKNRDRTINLSAMLHNGDSIAYMLDPKNFARFDHIITDIPYGINMDMLDQPNTGSDMSSVEKEHDVTYNMELIEAFFPAAFKCTNDNAFVITWCDAMLFSYMHLCATDAGFAVQRWPFIWCKTQANNQAPKYNQTKATEFAILCRKPGAIRQVTTGYNYLECGKDMLCDKLDHVFAKPFLLWERLVTEVSYKGQLILDPFAGRGSGPISFLRLGRKFCAVELNTNHYNALLENMKQEYLALNPDYLFL